MTITTSRRRPEPDLAAARMMGYEDFTVPFSTDEADLMAKMADDMRAKGWTVTVVPTSKGSVLCRKKVEIPLASGGPKL